MTTLIWSTVDGYIPGTRYNRRKEELRQEAIEWAANFDGWDCSYADLAEKQAYFERMGRRYGLLREFRENCIC